MSLRAMFPTVMATVLLAAGLARIDVYGEDREARPERDPATSRQASSEAPETGKEAEGEAGRTPSDGLVTYTVWLRRQRVHKVPRGFAPFVYVERGTELRVLDRRGDWVRVAWREDEERTHAGWTRTVPRERRAGELGEALAREASVSATVLAAKQAVERLLRSASRHAPRAERDFRTLDRAALDPEDVESFAEAGGLARPARR